MRRTADVVIVGGGIVGASIAYHLTRKGVRDVIVVERDRLGAGSTGKNAGGIRLQFSSEINVRLSQRALPRIEHFADEIGADPHFHQVGYLFLITDDRDVAPFERSLELWKRLEVPARRLDASGAHDLFPHARTDDVRFATFCAKDGYADSSSTRQSQRSSVKRHASPASARETTRSSRRPSSTRPVRGRRKSQSSPASTSRSSPSAGTSS